MIVAWETRASPRAAPAAMELRTNDPQVFRCGVGLPVEPDVKRTTAGWSAGKAGMFVGADPAERASG